MGPPKTRLRGIVAPQRSARLFDLTATSFLLEEVGLYLVFKDHARPCYFIPFHKKPNERTGERSKARLARPAPRLFPCRRALISSTVHRAAQPKFAVTGRT